MNKSNYLESMKVFGYSHGIRYNNVFELKAYIEFAILHSFNDYIKSTLTIIKTNFPSYILVNS